MEAVDKQGRPIYSSTYAQMVGNGQLLIGAGYVESSKKPNMFWRQAGNIRFYADMRGTEIIPIWEDPRPLLYLYPVDRSSEIAEDEKARLLSEEQGRLFNIGLPVRFNFYQESCEPAMWSLPQVRTCHCDKEFFGTSEYCSEACALGDMKSMVLDAIQTAPFCSVCKRKVLDEWMADQAKTILGIELGARLIVHHLSYVPEITAEVCQACHHRIHSGESGLEGWRNIDKRPPNYKARKPARQSSL